MNGLDGKPTKPDDDFEPLEPALEPWFETQRKFAELPAELQERITRDRRAAWLVLRWDVSTPGQRRNFAQERDCNADPANKDVADFWFEVPFRKPKLEAMKVQAQNVAAPDAISLAIRDAKLVYIDEAIDALPIDEEEVRSALPAELKPTIERVRRRWAELDKRTAALWPEGLSLVLAGVGGRPAGAAENGEIGKGGATERAETKRPIAPAAHDDAPRVPATPLPRRFGGQDFRATTRVLAEEVLEGVKDAKGQLLREWKACWELAPRAEGPGSRVSKQKRLSRMVKQLRREKSCLRTEPND